MNPQPGWYQSPNEPGLLRWWDGARWTQTTAPHAPTGYTPPPDSTVPVAASGQRVGPSPGRQWIWGFVYRRPLKTDWVFWWTIVVATLTVVAYVLVSDGLAGFLIDVLFTLPPAYIVLVLPIAAVRHWLVDDVREFLVIRRATRNSRPAAGQTHTATVRVGQTEVVFRRSLSGKVTAAARQGTLDAQTLERAKSRLRATQKAAGQRPWVIG
jgi:hypothetical protein